MKLKVGILGATGMVGQRFIEGLQDHPWFTVEALLASERSAGKKYSEAAKWYLPSSIPEEIADMTVEEMDPKNAEKLGLDLVFSAIPSELAREREAAFAKSIPVFSNTSTFRMDDDIPLIVPEVNPEHFSMIPAQQKKRGWKGYIVTNPNCTTIGFVIPLKPLMDSFGLSFVNVISMQALSGAGYEGVPSMAILDNVIPLIRGEEEKVEIEGNKILGKLKGDKVEYADFEVFAACNRVAVRDGHTEAVFVQTKKDFEIEEVKKVLSSFRGEPQKLKLPNAPEQPIIVMDAEDRPQPIFDRDAGSGMSVSVGRIRKKKEKLLKFVCLSHNTIRGAAGASILNAELARAKKLI
jgi:aspartate-semialdehyde dehydrogenase